MSCLYLSPEVTSLGLLSIELGRGSRLERYVSYASGSSAAQFRTDCRKSRSTKTPPTVQRKPLLHQFIPPAKSSTGFSRDFSSAISGFRSLCGQKQRSSLKPSRSNGPAFWNLSLGAGSRFENPGLHPQHLRGQHPWTDVVTERNRSGGIFQVVFRFLIWLLWGQFSARDRPLDASQIPFRRHI